MTQEEKREALIEYAKEHFRDLIPYSDPRYDERLQEWAETYADSKLKPNQEMEDYLNSLCEEHDKLIEDIEITQEDKELLLKDLSARLPYGCRVFYEYVDELNGKTYGYSINLNTWCINELEANKAVIKPYLRPMSSMTEEERNEISKLLNYEFYVDDDGALVAEDDRHRVRIELMKTYIDWLNAHHLDFRNLIQKGLAIEVTKENNPCKE